LVILEVGFGAMDEIENIEREKFDFWFYGFFGGEILGEEKKKKR
jgi:hypothetical protein